MSVSLPSFPYKLHQVIASVVIVSAPGPPRTTKPGPDVTTAVSSRSSRLMKLATKVSSIGPHCTSFGVTETHPAPAVIVAPMSVIVTVPAELEAVTSFASPEAAW